MKLNEAKQHFIQTWGLLGSKWGINRTMAQIHALLLLTQQPISAEDIMNELDISRGNANMNLRRLLEWELVRKEFKAGERKEFFIAEKNAVQVCKRIANERKKVELIPAKKALHKINIEEKTDEANAVMKTISDFREVTDLTETLINRIIDADENWIYNALTKIISETDAPHASKD